MKSSYFEETIDSAGTLTSRLYLAFLILSQLLAQKEIFCC